MQPGVFLKHLYLHGTPPEKHHDENLRTDRGKLAFLGRTAAGAGVIENLTESGDGSVAIPSLESSFSLDDLTVRLAKDRGAVASLLYYMGLLTLTDVPFRLRIPNLVVRKLFLDRLLEIFLPDVGDSSGAQEIALGFFRTETYDRYCNSLKRSFCRSSPTGTAVPLPRSLDRAVAV